MNNMVLNEPNSPMTLIEDIEISTQYYFLLHPIIGLEINKTIEQAPNNNLVFNKSAVQVQRMSKNWYLGAEQMRGEEMSDILSTHERWILASM